MARQHSSYPYDGDERHAANWYDQSHEDVTLGPGDRFLIPCEGGPSIYRLEVFPPHLEIAEHDGMYVLIDDGPRDEWRYVFVSNTP